MHYDFTAIPDADVPQAVEPVFQHIVTTYASEANKTASVWRAVPDATLRVRFALLTPMGLVELFRAAPGNRQRFPLLPGVDSGDLNDLADVVAGVAQGAFQGKRDRMRFPTDRHHPREAVGLQAFQRRQ